MPIVHIAMRIIFLLTLCVLLLRPCTTSSAQRKSHSIPADGAVVDITQRTCALYVVLHSAALGTVHFGRDMGDDMIRWYTCSTENRVACAQTRCTSRDSVHTAITSGDR